jgi:hypothetical protein
MVPGVLCICCFLVHRLLEGGRRKAGLMGGNWRSRELEKNRRVLARQAAKEQLANEKAERKALRAAKQTPKAAEVAERKLIAAETKAQRKPVQKATIQTSRSKKKGPLMPRSRKGRRKGFRTNFSQSRNATISNNSRTTPDTRDAQLSDDTTTVIEEPASQAVRRRNASGRPISLPLCFGRSINLPKRFRS